MRLFSDGHICAPECVRSGVSGRDSGPILNLVTFRWKRFCWICFWPIQQVRGFAFSCCSGSGRRCSCAQDFCGMYGSIFYLKSMYVWCFVHPVHRCTCTNAELASLLRFYIWLIVWKPCSELYFFFFFSFFLFFFFFFCFSFFLIFFFRACRIPIAVAISVKNYRVTSSDFF